MSSNIAFTRARKEVIGHQVVMMDTYEMVEQSHGYTGAVLARHEMDQRRRSVSERVAQ